MKKLSTKSIVIVLAVLTVIYMGYRIFESRNHMAALTEEANENNIMTVALVQATPLPVQETVVLPGNIQAWYQAPIYAQVSGYVKMWYKDWGAIVKEGDILAHIYAPALDAQYAQSKADLQSEIALNELAILTADRWKALRKNQAVSEQSISVKLAEAKAQQAKVNAAAQEVRNFEALINFKTIVAPYDGVIIERGINVGDFINKEGTISLPTGEVRNLYTVADMSRMRCFVSVPERFGAVMHDGLKAVVRVPQFPGRVFNAEFLTTARGFNVSTRTVVTQFVIENEARDLWPGSFASVTITVDVANQNYSIPTSALVFDDMQTRVAVVDDNSHVHFKPVKILRILDATIELEHGGVTLEDKIINNPSAALLEGDPVRVVTPQPGYGALEAEKKPDSESSNPATDTKKPDPGSSKPASHTKKPDPDTESSSLAPDSKMPEPGSSNPATDTKKPDPESSNPASHTKIPDPGFKQALNGSHAQ